MISGVMLFGSTGLGLLVTNEIFIVQLCAVSVAGNPEFSRSTNLQSKLIEFFVLVNFYHTVRFGSLEPFTVRKIGDLPHFLLALASKYQFIIKLVKM